MLPWLQSPRGGSSSDRYNDANENGSRSVPLPRLSEEDEKLRAIDRPGTAPIPVSPMTVANRKWQETHERPKTTGGAESQRIQSHPQVATLRAEVGRLQNALMERGSGQNQFMGGRQLRSGRSRKNHTSECDACLAMRGQTKRIREVNKDLRMHSEQAEHECGELDKANSHLGEIFDRTSREHRKEIAELSTELAEVRLRERRHHEEASSLQHEIALLLRTREMEQGEQEDEMLVAGPASPPAREVEVDEVMDAEHSRRMQETERVLARYTTELETLRSHHARIAANAETVEAQLQGLRRGKGGWEKQIVGAQVQASGLERAKEEAALELAEAEYESEASMGLVRGMRGQLAGEAEAAAAELASSYARLAQSRAGAEAALGAAVEGSAAVQAQVGEMERRVEGAWSRARAMRESAAGSLRRGSLGKEAADLEQLKREQQRLLKALEGMRRREGDREIESAESQAKRQEVEQQRQTEAQELARRVADTLDQVRQSRGAGADLHADVWAVKRQVQEAAQAVAAAEARIVASRGEKDELQNRVAEGRRKQIKALEAAMQSLVRLCVVAPTVNIRLAEQILACAQPVPTDEIRRLVEMEVLPSFSSIFLQVHEGQGPDGTPLEKWLEILLSEMQQCIQGHLKTLFQQLRRNR